MTKGKIWSAEEEQQLRSLVGAGLGLSEISEEMDKSRGSVKAKMFDLGLHVAQKPPIGSAEGAGVLEVADDLPSIQEKLLVHDAASRALQRGDLSRTDILRLRTIMQGAMDYNKMYALFVNYRNLEREVMSLRRELEAKNRSEDAKKGS